MPSYTLKQFEAAHDIFKNPMTGQDWTCAEMEATAWEILNRARWEAEEEHWFDETIKGVWIGTGPMYDDDVNFVTVMAHTVAKYTGQKIDVRGPSWDYDSAMDPENIAYQWFMHAAHGLLTEQAEGKTMREFHAWLAQLVPPRKARKEVAIHLAFVKAACARKTIEEMGGYWKGSGSYVIGEKMPVAAKLSGPVLFIDPFYGRDVA